ncbi:hemerythrin domain-containing protein [Pontibacter akesuensis]|uniref:Hemerythrin HHE cation binding domain-containing protein n=1 Tax=Pontibacter akesuensis TaxID=388950 RepID=A0A1I7K913_9BACT|nr:hemerythrin domain-containing protein [Pontibacter akesuensis]GHA74166.1 hypothetical protein GCM10007389_29770 [Pontibacter akesuensis]SFU93880.1 Hemerythrin HHE cation binding domain-containing protein [Pontibacter akesuensis]
MPIKRHISLQPISRQHHAGLLTARLLQHGAPPYKGMPTTPAAKRDYVLQFLERELLPHFELEEETVFILACEGSEDLQQQAQALQTEHQLLQQLILGLPQAEESTLPDTLHEIGKLLERHIRQEERVFFEQLQQASTKQQLLQLQEQIAQHLA